MLGLETVAQKEYVPSPISQEIVYTDYKKDRKKSKKDRADIRDSLKDKEYLYSIVSEANKQALEEEYFKGRDYDNLDIRSKEEVDKVIQEILDTYSQLPKRDWYNRNQEPTKIGEIELKILEKFTEALKNK